MPRRPHPVRSARRVDEVEEKMRKAIKWMRARSDRLIAFAIPPGKNEGYGSLRIASTNPPLAGSHHFGYTGEVRLSMRPNDMADADAPRPQRTGWASLRDLTGY